MHTLNQAERETLNAAMAILERCTAQGALWQMTGRRDADQFDGDFLYIDCANSGHAILGETLADKVQNALDIEAYAASGEAA